MSVMVLIVSACVVPPAILVEMIVVIPAQAVIVRVMVIVHHATNAVQVVRPLLVSVISSQPVLRASMNVTHLIVIVLAVII